jgi:hypothetical protein
MSFKLQRKAILLWGNTTNARKWLISISYLGNKWILATPQYPLGCEKAAIYHNNMHRIMRHNENLRIDKAMNKMLEDQGFKLPSIVSHN